MAQYPGIPWDQRPDYLALAQRVDPAGIVTDYNPPRPGLSPTDVTSFIYGQATITMRNWPEIMYYLNRTPEWTEFRSAPRPPQKLDANGQPMFELFPCQGQTPRPLLDLPILPDTICSQEYLWWIELWRRMDPRIQWEDILMRIEIRDRTKGSDKLVRNSTNNLINRREHPWFNMLAWHSKGDNSENANEVRTLVLGRVAAAQPPLPPNSTRGLTPGLIDPSLGDVPGNIVLLSEYGPGRLSLRRRQGNRTPKKRGRGSQKGNGPPQKSETPDPNDDDDMYTGFDESLGLEDIPVAKKARVQPAGTRKKVTFNITAEKASYQIHLEGDPTFEAAFQASRRGRQPAQRRPAQNVSTLSNAARFGLPVAQPGRPCQHVYVRMADGSHRHYTDGSGIPAYVTRPEPSSNVRIGFTAKQLAEVKAQTDARRNAAQSVDPPLPDRLDMPARLTLDDISRQATSNPRRRGHRSGPAPRPTANRVGWQWK